MLPQKTGRSLTRGLRVAYFIDGNNIAHQASWLGVRVDYFGLKRYLQQDFFSEAVRFLRAILYRSVSTEPLDVERIMRGEGDEYDRRRLSAMNFALGLRSAGYEVREHPQRKVGEFYKDDVDSVIAHDIGRYARLKFDVIILMSCDGDFAHPLKMAMEQNPGLQVLVLTFKRRASRLLEEAGEIWDLEEEPFAQFLLSKLAATPPLVTIEPVVITPTAMNEVGPVPAPTVSPPEDCVVQRTL